MILTCPSCTTRYEVDAAKFPPAGRTVRCAKCGHVWHAERPEEAAPVFEAPEPEAYQPPAEPDPYDSDGETQAADTGYAAADENAPKAEAWYVRKPVLMAGWAGLAAIVLVVGFVASVYRREVVEVWPKSASFYSGLGVKVVPSGLKLGNTKTSEAPQNGRIVLTVSGAVTNVTGRELPVPQIRVGLVDHDKRELYHWTVAPQVMTLKPGQSTHFVTRLSNPPDGAASYEVRFAKAGE
jgi:predicted Zn finger-like uncharacterized protein